LVRYLLDAPDARAPRASLSSFAALG